MIGSRRSVGIMCILEINKERNHQAEAIKTPSRWLVWRNVCRKKMYAYAPLVYDTILQIRRTKSLVNDIVEILIIREYVLPAKRDNKSQLDISDIPFSNH